MLHGDVVGILRAAFKIGLFALWGIIIGITIPQGNSDEFLARHVLRNDESSIGFQYITAVSGSDVFRSDSTHSAV